MADESTEKNLPAENEDIDLSSLSSISLGPDWLSGKKPSSRAPRTQRDDRSSGPKGPHRDRRGSMPPRRDGPDRSPRGDQRQGRREHRERDHRPEPFHPNVAVDFYPEEEPFKVLSQAIRNSCRTFELFEIARLILDKTDRFVCVVRDPAQKEGEPALLYASVPDGLPFTTEDEAMAHTFRHYLDEFFTIETIEADPPAGSFQMIHKCGMTGDLLAPPNYHRYQAICREHHAAKLGHVPYSRFEERIESSREDEDIQAWLTQMKTQTRYTSKENPEQSFSSLEDARLYLSTEAKEKLVRPAYSARFSGKSLTLLDPGNMIRRSVEYLLEGQKRFPLETANHLRGRLRRMHYAVYKRGSKGVSFVCAVKRHFRKPNEILADNLQALIDFLEAHPNFPAKDLPKAYLGIEPKAPLEKPETGSSPDNAPEPEAEAVAEATPEAVAEPVAEPESAAAAPKAGISDAEAQALKVLKTDLHYLVSQGYVIEYSDGRLFVPPIREDEIRHLEKEKAAALKAAEKPATSPADAVVEDPGTKPVSEESVKEPEPVAPETTPEAIPPVESVEEQSVKEPAPAAPETSPEVIPPVKSVEEDSASETKPGTSES